MTARSHTRTRRKEAARARRALQRRTARLTRRKKGPQ